MTSASYRVTGAQSRSSLVICTATTCTLEDGGATLHVTIQLAARLSILTLPSYPVVISEMVGFADGQGERLDASLNEDQTLGADDR